MEIICRDCASYNQCNRKNKNTATKCSGFWEHIPTSAFTDAIEAKEKKNPKPVKPVNKYENMGALEILSTFEKTHLEDQDSEIFKDFQLLKNHFNLLFDAIK